ncbi:acetyl-CoA hydrolase/transferase C-terminal domain-containing protein, partial [Mycoplasmopsis synoviae]
DNLVSINSTIEIDLTWAFNYKYLNDHQFSGTGGQFDFVRVAYMSQGEKSSITLTSTTKNKKFSKIVSMLSCPTFTLIIDVHWVVTEYVAVNLKGLNSVQISR